jgi:hypothetical protein
MWSIARHDDILRIRQAKATGLRNLPCHRSDANAAWLEIILAATDLVAARITRGARQIRLGSTPPGVGLPPFPKHGNDFEPPSADATTTIQPTRGSSTPSVIMEAWATTRRSSSPAPRPASAGPPR